MNSSDSESMEEIEVTKKPVRIVRAITKEQSDDEPGEEHEETKSRKVELKRESDGESKKSKVKKNFIHSDLIWSF